MKHNYLRRVFFRYFLPAVVMLVLWYGVLSMLSPGRRLAEIRNDYGKSEKEGLKVGEWIRTDPEYLKLLKEKEHLRAKVAMASTDSVYFVVNLSDSTGSLEISGVRVYTAQISRTGASRILRKGDVPAVTEYLSGPLNIIREYSTVRKEPLMVKKAPRDTSEYIPDIIPDTSYIEPVSYILELDRGIRLIVRQEEVNGFGDWYSLLKFDLNDRLRNTWRSFRRIIMFRIPEYQSFVSIRLPGEEARTIFRAIPRNGQLTILQ